MDGSSPSAMLRAFLPKVPMIVQAAVYHSLWLSPMSTKWDLRTELTVKILRSFLDSPRPSPISRQQRMTLKDPGIKGPMWISKVEFPVPEETAVRDWLMSAVESMKEGGEISTIPDIKPVEAEWTGHRAGVDATRHRPDLSEKQHYEKLMNDVTSDVTVLYFHGGAMYLCDPCTHRPFTSKIARLTGGRCLSVRYSLAPQNAFPAALLDSLIAYLSLLYPPPGALHEPVPASQVVFSGDSAGGNLAFSLLQLLLHDHRTSASSATTIRYNNRDVELPLPAGVACNSAWLDSTRSMPSVTNNAKYDYLPPPPSNKVIKHFPKCDIWPTDPPRRDLYCHESMLCHPLVSPLAAKDWEGTCPVWFSYGTEMLLDEGQVLASRIARQGGRVQFEEYEAMPHVFPLLLDFLNCSKACVLSCAEFMKDVVGNKTIEMRGVTVKAKTLKMEARDVEKLAPLSDEEVDRIMREAMRKRSFGEETETKVMPRAAL